MPVGPGTPYDTAGYVLQQAIIATNDAGGPNGLAGDILNADMPYTIPLLNERYRWLQQYLASRSVETFSKYAFIIGLTPANTGNPSVDVTIDYAGYYDGAMKWGPPLTLPEDMIKPLELWERQTGNNVWVPMRQAADSISTRPQMPRFNIWDFQNDVLILPGATQTNDLKFKYICFAPDLTTLASPVLVIRCQTALSYLVAEKAAEMRGGLEMAAAYHEKAEAAISEIVNRTARKEQYVNYHRLPFRARNSRRGQY